MRYLVFSDIHGNLPALETLLQKEVVDAYINLGDVVNYAPWSNECAELIHSLNQCTNIVGNHEEYFISKKSKAKHPLVSLFFEVCFPSFKHHDLISKYKSSESIEGFLFKHTHNKQYIFSDTAVDIAQNTVIGHSHQQFSRRIDNHLLINPGSAGQNREFINLGEYAIWDLSKDTFELKYFTFDIDIVINEMKARKFPIACIEYYQNKKRVNV